MRKTFTHFILISFLYFSHVSLGSSDTDDDEDTSTVIVRYPEFKAGSTQQPFYSSSPSAESSTSKEMDKISIDSFIDSDMVPEVRLLAHFSHTVSDTIKAFADSHCSENLHSLQNCDNLWYFWYCPFLMHTLTCCLSQFYWTLLLCWILQSCYWISSLFPTLSTSSTVFVSAISMLSCLSLSASLTDF